MLYPLSYGRPPGRHHAGTGVAECIGTPGRRETAARWPPRERIRAGQRPCACWNGPMAASRRWRYLEPPRTLARLSSIPGEGGPQWGGASARGNARRGGSRNEGREDRENDDPPREPSGG